MRFSLPTGVSHPPHTPGAYSSERAIAVRASPWRGSEFRPPKMIRALPQQQRDLLGRDGPQLQECPEFGTNALQLFTPRNGLISIYFSPSSMLPEESGPE